MCKIRENQGGLTMVEVLVAVTVLVVAGTIALLIYDQSRKSFKRGENLSEQQQGVRIAFDRLVADLRMAGFNYNPDGDKTRPDEQIEAAYDTAIVIRADFDAEDPSLSATPEATLAGGPFLTVSTGNDEIVAYVLAKPDGSSTDTLTFEADVAESARDGDVETVSIPNVALVQDDPPYTLYRITLNNDSSTWGSSNFIVRTPLMDNVRSLSFRYYDQVGSQVNSVFDLSSTAEDIGGAETASGTRGTIRRIEIDLEGLTDDPDLGWVDPNDTDPDTRAHRKFRLTGDVVPRNLGKVGIRDLSADITPPSQPGTPTLVPGHCEGLYISWPANPSEDQVVSYRVNLGTSPGSYTDQRTTGATSLYVSALSDATTYYVSIQAADAAGNLSQNSTEVSATTSNVNTPETVQNLSATSNLNGVVSLDWDAVTQNAETDPTGDPASPMIRDLAGYRVYRDTSSKFKADTAHQIADESVVGNKPSPDFNDANVVNCQTYYYKIRAVDACGALGDPTSAVAGQAVTSELPATPGNVQATFSGSNQVKITWGAVTQDASGQPIYIDTYKVYRSSLVPDGSPPPDPDTFVLRATVTGATDYLDSAVVPQGYAYFYQVSAVDACPNESVRSAPVKPECAFTGDVQIVSPTSGASVAGVVPVQVQVVNGAETYAKVTLEFYNANTGQVEDQTEIQDPGPVWNYNWLADPPGPYTITATVETTTGCSKSASVNVAAGFDVGCCLSPPNPDLDPIVLNCTGPGNPQVECKEISYDLINNNCLTAVAIEQMTVTWVDVVGNGAKMTGVKFDGVPIWNVVPASSSPASNTFSSPQPTIDVTRDSLNPVLVTYTYDQVTSDKQGSNFLRNSLTTSYSFRLLNGQGQPTAITGTCGPSTGMFDNMIVEQHN